MRHFILLSIAFVTSQVFSESSLRELADKRGLYIGTFFEHNLYTGQDSEIYQKTLKREFSLATVGVYPQFTHPEENVWHLEKPDALADFLTSNGIKIRIHPLVWWNDAIDPNPHWMDKYSDNPERLGAALKEHVQTLVRHFRDKYPHQVIAYDVVNEPLENLGTTLRKNVWWGVHPEKPMLYIRDAFVWAREADPDAKLFLNEIFTERSDEKFEALIELIQELKREGAPIDGIGIQMHQFAPLASRADLPVPGYGMAMAVSPRKIERRLRRLETLGLKIQFTEMDIPLPNPDTDNHALGSEAQEAFQFAEQKRLYHGYVRACVNSPSCEAIVFWGISDKDSWIPLYFPKFSRPLLFDNLFGQKPAYEGVMRALQ